MRNCHWVNLFHHMQLYLFKIIIVYFSARPEFQFTLSFSSLLPTVQNFICPENIHTPPLYGSQFFGLNCSTPLEFAVNASCFLLKIWLLKFSLPALLLAGFLEPGKPYKDCVYVCCQLVLTEDSHFLKSPSILFLNSYHTTDKLQKLHKQTLQLKKWFPLDYKVRYE